jgi:Alginate lyase.
MKNLFFIFVFSLITQITLAQYVGLNNKEVSSLQKLIKKDSSVKNLYISLKKLADAALTQTPDPIDTIVSEGHLANDPKKIITGRSLRDIDKIHALAEAYIIENNPSYLNKLVEFLSAWATVNKPQGNPINDTKFEDLFVAYDLTKNKIPSSSKKIIESWLATIADEEINTGKNKMKTTSFNNWNSHRLKTIGNIAYILNNDTYKKYIDEELPKQIEKNLLPDGSGFDFHERDALHYHTYTLEPLINLATIIKRATGKDYYNYISLTGSSIKRSIDFLIPFVTGEKTHGEFTNSKVAFDKKRADNKEPGYVIGASFVPSKGIPVLIEAAYFEPPLMDVAKKVSHNENDYPNWQSVLNKVRK